MLTFFRVCCLLATCLAAITLFVGLMMANGAPQQAAIGAIAVAMAVIPYVFTRMIEAMDASDSGKNDRADK